MATLPAIAGAPAPLPQPTPKPDKVADRLIVGFDDGVSLSRREAIIEAASGTPDLSLRGLPVNRVRPRGSLQLSTLKQRLLANSDVRYVESDYLITASKTPNDPLFATQYGLGNAADADIDASEAWESKTKCAKVAVLDSGVDIDHPDLASNLWTNSKETEGNGKDDDDNGYVDDYYGVDVRTGRGSGVDQNGHGTHVAGTIAAVANNGVGVSGVCWTGNVMSVKFMSANGSGATSDAVEGIEYAVKKGAKIINASFGSSSKSSALQDAVNYAQDNGVLIVAAAGNDGKDIDNSPVYPASYADSNILTVAASTSGDQLAAFSNYGDTSVDVAAAGENILSTYMGDSYRVLSGTSMAAPMIAGMAGILRAKNKEASYSQLRAGLRKKVNKPSGLKDKVVYDGRANLKKAIDYIVTVD